MLDYTWVDQYTGVELGRQLLHSSGCCVTLYWRTHLLEHTLIKFEDENFYKYQFDCSKWENTSDFHESFFKGMNFPSYYGRNMDAFNDSLGDAITTDKVGVVLALRHYNHYHEKNPKASTIALDIMQDNAWHRLIDGRLLVVLLQSDDPKFHVEIGSSAPSWNMDEWMDKDRRQSEDRRET